MSAAARRLYLGFVADNQRGKWRRLKYEGENSLILTAPPGSGKFTRQLALILLTYLGAVVIYDPKGESAAVTARFRSSLGPVHIIDPFGVLKKLGYEVETACFNPLAALDPESEEFSADVGLLVDALLIPSTSQRFFTDGAKQIVQAIIEHERSVRPDASLVDVYRVLWLPHVEFIAYMLAELAQSPSQNARNIAANFTSEAAPRSLMEQWADAKTQLGTFLNSEGIKRFLSASSFAWQDLKRGTATVYIVMPEQHAKAYARFTRLLFSSAMKAVIAAPRADVLFLMDEIATSLGGSGLEIVNTAFTLGRGYGVRVLAVLQSWAQTAEIWPEQADSMVASSGVLQFFKPRDGKTAHFIRERAGDTTVVFETESVSESWGNSIGGETEGLSRSRSTQIAGMPLYREQDLYSLGAGMKAGGSAPQILFMDGLGRPVEAWTLPYWHKAYGFDGLHDPNPYAPGYIRPAAPVTLI